jgi:phosphoribosylaminoimidazolecarboxamide formyltransferase/IMP cyclohydrolase
MKKYALLSVTNKTGIVDFARALMERGYTLLSTGGTASLLKEHRILTIEVSEFTGFAEILEGRVKTLNPKIHSGILFDREKHRKEAELLKIDAIDVVVVNLYNFAEAKEKKLPLEHAIEFIDIGGPTMLRAAAKNWKYVLPVIDPHDYPSIISEWSSQGISEQTRKKLAFKVFHSISKYDSMIAEYFESQEPRETVNLSLNLVSNLRYGENPKQKASIYRLAHQSKEGFCNIDILQGKELSYNNFLDLEAASSIVREFPDRPAITIVKHNNPCGTAIQVANESLSEIYLKSLSGDPKSAFGGIVATNAEIDETVAMKMAELFLECIIAPSFTAGALKVFSAKKNLRLISASWITTPNKPGLNYRSIHGAFLIQDEDSISPSGWTVKTKSQPNDEEMRDLEFAWKVSAHVKSNAIVYAKNSTTLTIGAGQMSRIDAANFAAEKALIEGKVLKGSVMASDAFFPFRDTVDLAAKYGIRCIIQPGGSLKDQDSIDACNEAGIAMVFTGERHFKH